jgi:uncharacterized protein
MAQQQQDSPREGMSVSEAGRKGGETTMERHGTEFYQRIGKKGGQEMKRLIALGKAEEARG